MTDDVSDVSSPVPSPAFDDVLAANDAYAAAFDLAGVSNQAARQLAVVTCIDTRIEPLGMLGLKPGDAKVLRNAGARVTDDVLDTLVLAAYTLGVRRVMVVCHTRCKVAEVDEARVHELIAASGGPDTRSLRFDMVGDQLERLGRDVQRIRSSPFLPADVQVGGFRYDVDTGRITQHS